MLSRRLFNKKTLCLESRMETSDCIYEEH